MWRIVGIVAAVVGLMATWVYAFPDAAISCDRAADGSSCFYEITRPLKTSELLVPGVDEARARVADRILPPDDGKLDLVAGDEVTTVQHRGLLPSQARRAADELNAFRAGDAPRVRVTLTSSQPWAWPVSIALFGLLAWLMVAGFLPGRRRASSRRTGPAGFPASSLLAPRDAPSDAAAEPPPSGTPADRVAPSPGAPTPGSGAPPPQPPARPPQPPTLGPVPRPYELEQAVRHRDLQRVDRLLTAGLEINAMSPAGTVLHIAAGRSDASMVAELLHRGADPNLPARRSPGDTPLMTAARENASPEVFEAPLDGGARVDDRNSRGESALVLASQSDCVPMVFRQLLAAGADPRAESDFGTQPLDSAASHHEVEVVRLLIGAGGDVRRAAALGRTPAFNAGAGRKYENMLLLVQRAAEVGSPLAVGSGEAEVARRGEPLGRVQPSAATLFGSIRAGDAELVRTVLAAGVDPNSPAYLHPDVSPLDTAIRTGATAEIVTLLTRAGAQWSSGGSSSLCDALRSKRPPEVIRALLDAGADPRTGDAHGTPLTLAATNYAPDVIDLLLAGGADLEQPDSAGRTPLMLATTNANHLDTFARLLAAGADARARTPEGATTVMHAAKSELDGGAIPALVSKGADPFATDNDGLPAIRMAVRNHAGLPHLQALAGLGADLRARFVEGSTLLMHAADAGVGEIVLWLLDSGADPDARDDFGRRAVDVLHPSLVNHPAGEALRSARGPQDRPAG